LREVLDMSLEFFRLKRIYRAAKAMQAKILMPFETIIRTS